MANPKFQPTDKIIYENPYFVRQPLSPRAQTEAPPTVYVVVAFSAQTGTYVVTIPTYKDAGGIRRFTQFDLENNFRLADPYEVDLYFS
jgi:hypothetical protein